MSGNVSLSPSTAGLSSFTIRSGTAAKSQEKSSYVQYSMLMLFLYWFFTENPSWSSLTQKLTPLQKIVRPIGMLMRWKNWWKKRCIKPALSIHVGSSDNKNICFMWWRAESGRPGGRRGTYSFIFIWSLDLIASIECKKDDYLKWFVNAQNLVWCLQQPYYY